MDPLLNSGCTSLYVIGCAPFNYKYPVVAIVRTSVLCLFLSCESNPHVTFELNAWLDLSWQATTKSLGPLQMEFLLQVLGESTWTMTVWVIRGDEGVGDISGVQGDSGEPVGSAQ